MTSFADRDRGDLETVTKWYKETSGWIPHMLLNDDGTYSIMLHINCEWCDYCEAEDAASRVGIRNGWSLDRPPLIHQAKEDPYENANKAE